jgi:hypothetical protein
VQFVPNCHDAAFNLKISAIDQRIECASLSLKILMDLLSADSDQKDASRQLCRALFVAAHETTLLSRPSCD